ncbi:MAG TPA: hypothetical protein VEM57_07540, partial [Candidatus Binatus sp.]|nr:hypothetical protein [Candidatus Binatus sp.]
MGKVTASLDTSHYKGAITKTVTVTTADPGSTPVVLQLRAEIMTSFDVTPSETPLIRMIAGELKPTELTLSAVDARPFAVLSVQADPAVAVTVRPSPGAPTGEAAARPGAVAAGSSRYVVTITPKPDVPAGEQVQNVTLTTDRAKEKTVLIRAVLVVLARLRIAPERLLVEPGAEPPVLHVRIRKRAGDGLKIMDVASSDADFSATLSAIEDGREYDVAVRYTGQPGRGPVDARITAQTNEPGQTAIVIPLTGRI